VGNKALQSSAITNNTKPTQNIGNQAHETKTRVIIANSAQQIPNFSSKIDQPYHHSPKDPQLCIKRKKERKEKKEKRKEFEQLYQVSAMCT